jgi:DNA-binding SARP family transcriptional activator
VAIPAGGKIEALLRVLGLSPEHASTRDVLLEALWPNRPPSRAGQSLNSLVHVLNKSLCAALRGAAPVLHAGTLYRLNTQAGVGVDFVLFERLAREGDEHAQQGRIADAVGAYRAAVRLYEGDLCVGTDLESVIERERLRAIYLTLLARLAEHEYCDRDAAAALHYALRLLNADPCREDAHRMAMRCYVRLGQRAQALRQFRLCEDFLHAEFDAAPESATVALFEQIRLHPDDTQSR